MLRHVRIYVQGITKTDLESKLHKKFGKKNSRFLRYSFVISYVNGDPSAGDEVRYYRQSVTGQNAAYTKGERKRHTDKMLPKNHHTDKMSSHRMSGKKYHTHKMSRNKISPEKNAAQTKCHHTRLEKLTKMVYP